MLPSDDVRVGSLGGEQEPRWREGDPRDKRKILLWTSFVADVKFFYNLKKIKDIIFVLNS